jgi:predicted lactoylglutathione lyase
MPKTIFVNLPVTDLKRSTAFYEAVGARIDLTPTQDFSFMYGRSFEDPDGHIWQVMWMDLAAAQAATAPQTADA